MTKNTKTLEWLNECQTLLEPTEIKEEAKPEWELKEISFSHIKKKIMDPDSTFL